MKEQGLMGDSRTGPDRCCGPEAKEPTGKALYRQGASWLLSHILQSECTPEMIMIVFGGANRALDLPNGRVGSSVSASRRCLHLGGWLINGL